MVRDGLDDWWRLDGRRDAAAHQSGDGHNDCCSESRLVAAHVVYTMAWLLVQLGLPGLYAAQRGGMGRLGVAGFLTAFTGTYLSTAAWPIAILGSASLDAGLAGAGYRLSHTLAASDLLPPDK